MVQASRTIKVNTDPREPKLTRSLVWRGLMMKAENPLPFVPVITACRIVERQGEDRFVREIVDKGDTITEVVTLHPERMVKFERTSGRVLGTILNEIIEDGDGDLALKFTFNLEVEGIEPGECGGTRVRRPDGSGLPDGGRGNPQSGAQACRGECADRRLASCEYRRSTPMAAQAAPSITRINPPELGSPPGYSQVVDVRAGRFVFIAGQTALNHEGELVGKNDFAAQADQVFYNLGAALAAAGCSAGNLIKLTVFLRNMENLSAYREARNRFFATVAPPAAPAVTLVEVSKLYGADFLIEIEAIAAA